VGPVVSSGVGVGLAADAPGPGVGLEVAAVDPVGDALGALAQAAINITVASAVPTRTIPCPRSTRLPSFVSSRTRPLTSGSDPMLRDALERSVN
jgi:hypothetical protein